MKPRQGPGSRDQAKNRGKGRKMKHYRELAAWRGRDQGVGIRDQAGSRGGVTKMPRCLKTRYTTEISASLHPRFCRCLHDNGISPLAPVRLQRWHG